MSLVYRGIWQDERADLCAAALDDLRLWVGEKYESQIQVPDSGSAHAVVGPGSRCCEVEVGVESAEAADGSVSTLRAFVAEVRADGVRWKTTLRVWEDGATAAGFAWVDLSVVGEGLNLQTLAPAAPRLVRNMLTAAVNPRLGSQRMWTAPVSFSGRGGGEELAELVSDFERSVPMVVFTRDDARFEVYGDIETYTFDDIVARAATQIAGVANVAVLDKLGADAFTEALTESHGVWDGAFRVYLGNLDPAAPDDAWRHQYVTADRYMGRFTTAANLLARILSTISPTRRPPESFTTAKRVLDEARTGKRDIDELVRYADSEIDRRSREIIDLRQRVSELEEDLLGFEIDQIEMLDELDRVTAKSIVLQRQVEHYEQLLRVADGAEVPVAGDEGDGIPQGAANATDAVHKARQHLSDRLLIPDGAYSERDLEKLDCAVNSASWGRQAWRGFRALHAYACDLASGAWTTGGFWYWCKDSDNSLTWPASQKRLVMRESDSVCQDRRLRQQRVLPVATEVDARGEIFMEAHLKIAEGGGDLAPRIYFHIDNRRAKVHIGYFGPHYTMKNTRS